MVILIGGATHAGKTALAQRLLEKYKFPYLSLDHLKMGLIRSGQTSLTPCDDEKLLPYIWSIAKEIVKTAIENGQNMIIEGCYIPFDYKNYFEKEYLEKIRYVCIVMTEEYIERNFDKIIKYENVIEKRLKSADLTKENLIAENRDIMENCLKYGCNFREITAKYALDLNDLF